MLLLLKRKVSVELWENISFTSFFCLFLITIVSEKSEPVEFFLLTASFSHSVTLKLLELLYVILYMNLTIITALSIVRSFYKTEKSTHIYII